MVQEEAGQTLDDNGSSTDETKPWLTVIIPVYNDGKIAVNAIRASLESADGDTGVEVICVEGGSADDSVAVLEEYRKSEPRFRVVICESSAVSPKFNLGTKEARGEWLAFTESDCVPDKGWIPALKKVADAGQVVACAGRVIAASDDPNLQLSIRDSLLRKEVKPGFMNKALAFYHGQGNNFLIRRNILNDIGGIDERLGAGAPSRSGQDAELNFRLLSAGYPIGFEPDALVVHHPQETRESFLRKKRNYYFAGVWWIVVVHPFSLPCLFALKLRYLYPPAAMLASLLTFKGKRFQRHWEEWKGFWGGLYSGLKFKIFGQRNQDS